MGTHLLFQDQDDEGQEEQSDNVQQRSNSAMPAIGLSGNEEKEKDL